MEPSARSGRTATLLILIAPALLAAQPITPSRTNWPLVGGTTTSRLGFVNLAVRGL